MQIFGRRNSSRQGALSKQGDGVVAYVEPKRVEDQRSIGRFIRKSSLAGEIRQDKAHRASKATAYLHTSSQSASRSNVVSADLSAKEKSHAYAWPHIYEEYFKYSLKTE